MNNVLDISTYQKFQATIRGRHLCVAGVSGGEGRGEVRATDPGPQRRLLKTN